MSSGRLRLVLLLDAAAIAAVALAVLLGAGLPVAAHGALGARAFVGLAAAAAAVALAAGAALLVRWVARPVERVLAAAARVEAGEAAELPLVAERGGLGAAAVAFERAAGALAAERARLAAKVEELSAANRALADTRESLLRSERLATVGRLAAGVAHEVGNPLGAITAYADLARGRLPGEAAEARDYLGRISAEAARIDAIVRDLLDFARPAALRVGAADAAAAIDAALRLARVQPRFRAVDAAVDVPAALPPVVADERRLAQVLLNLLLNSADAMGGAGRVRIAAREDAEAIEVRVEDEGPGIAAEDLPRVFDPFFTTKAPGQGTGLGLSICHRIMESFGGAISASNRAGGGAVLTLRFRRAALGGRAGEAGAPASPARMVR